MEIQQIRFQYANPSKRNKHKFLTETTWHKYYNAIFDKNYFTEDELEFLKALKSDLEKELIETEENIKKLTKTR